MMTGAVEGGFAGRAQSCSPVHLRTADVGLGFDLKRAVLDAVATLQEVAGLIQDAVPIGTGCDLDVG